MTLLLDLLIISFIVVFIIDLSGVIDDAERKLGKWLKCKARIPKPFSCSLCSTFWLGLLYLLITHNLTIPLIGYVSLLAFLTPTFNNVLLTVKDAILFVINKIDKIFY